MGQFNQKEEYMESLMIQIRNHKAKKLIAKEMEGHIEDQKSAYIMDGEEEGQALKKAIEQMGDPTEVGTELNKIHRPKRAWALMGMVLVLSLIGVCAQISVANHYNSIEGISIFRHVIILCVGIVIMVGLQFVDYTLIGIYPKWIYIGILLGYIVQGLYLPVVNGQYPQLISYSLLLLPVYGAVLYSYRKRRYLGLLSAILFPVVGCFIQMQFINQASIYLGILYACMLMLSIAIWRKWFEVPRVRVLLILWSGIIISQITFVRLLYYRMARIRNMFQILMNPESSDYGYVITAVRKTLKRASAFQGSPEKLEEYIGNIHNDYILTYVIGTWGWAIGILVILLCVFIMIGMIRLSLRMTKPLALYVSLGCSLVYAIQGVVYIMANLGFQIFAQVNLPFVSYGGRGLIINFIILGIYLSIYRNQMITEEPYSGRKWRLRLEKVVH